MATIKSSKTRRNGSPVASKYHPSLVGATGQWAADCDLNLALHAIAKFISKNYDPSKAFRWRGGAAKVGLKYAIDLNLDHGFKHLGACRFLMGDETIEALQAHLVNGAARALMALQLFEELKRDKATR